MDIFNNLKTYNSSSKVLKSKEPILEKEGHFTKPSYESTVKMGPGKF